MTINQSRRQFLATSVASATSIPFAIDALNNPATAANESSFRLNYIVGSCMYGYESLAKVIPEVKKTGASFIDIWPMVHGNQREQVDEMGEEDFAELLRKHNVGLGCITQYKLGPFKLQEEMRLANRLGCKMIVTGGSGPIHLKGSELKNAVADFVEKMKPHLEVAEQTGVTISIENHANNLIDSADSLRYLADLRPSSQLSIALAPYHLPQDAKMLSKLILDLGGAISMFYAWEHGKGCMTAQPKADELMQLPGRGKLDFAPMLEALREINFQGWTEIFMHPYPRGLAVVESIDGVTAEINRSRHYLESLLRPQS